MPALRITSMPALRRKKPSAPNERRTLLDASEAHSSRGVSASAGRRRPGHNSERSRMSGSQPPFTRLPAYARRFISISSRVAVAILRAPRFLVSAGGAERHLKVESLCFLEMIDHIEKITSLRIAVGT
jgi:hypothetical protein